MSPTISCPRRFSALLVRSEFASPASCCGVLLVDHDVEIGFGSTHFFSWWAPQSRTDRIWFLPEIGIFEENPPKPEFHGVSVKREQASGTLRHQFCRSVVQTQLSHDTQLLYTRTWTGFRGQGPTCCRGNVGPVGTPHKVRTWLWELELTATPTPTKVTLVARKVTESKGCQACHVSWHTMQQHAMHRGEALHRTVEISGLAMTWREKNKIRQLEDGDRDHIESASNKRFVRRVGLERSGGFLKFHWIELFVMSLAFFHCLAVSTAPNRLAFCSATRRWETAPRWWFLSSQSLRDKIGCQLGQREDFCFLRSMATTVTGQCFYSHVSMLFILPQVIDSIQNITLMEVYTGRVGRIEQNRPQNLLESKPLSLSIGQVLFQHCHAAAIGQGLRSLEKNESQHLIEFSTAKPVGWDSWRWLKQSNQIRPVSVSLSLDCRIVSKELLFGRQARQLGESHRYPPIWRYLFSGCQVCQVCRPINCRSTSYKLKASPAFTMSFQLFRPAQSGWPWSLTLMQSSVDFNRALNWVSRIIRAWFWAKAWSVWWRTAFFHFYSPVKGSNTNSTMTCFDRGDP